MTPNDVVASGYRMAKLLIHRMVDDLAPADFRHQLAAGANSAGWIVGHLAITLRRTAERLGATDLPAIPAEIIGQFTQTGKPAGEQSDFGDPAELLRLFDTCADKVIEAVKLLPAETFDNPPLQPGPLAKTYGDSLLFGTLHVTMHSGQLSSIRRSLGKPPVV